MQINIVKKPYAKAKGFFNMKFIPAKNPYKASAKIR